MRRESLDGDRVFVVHDLLSREECDELVARSEAIGFAAAEVGGVPIPEIRDNGRAFLEDASLAEMLWRRLAPFVPATLNGGVASGLHPKFRFYRYAVAERFLIHMDGAVTRGNCEVSQLTFLVYLSDVEAGGETNFYELGDILQFSIKPSPGKALLFAHESLHEGAPVIRGHKYVLRTDVLYRWNSPAEMPR